MKIETILLIITFTVVLRIMIHFWGKVWPLTVAALLFLFWMQPALPVRYLGFWFSCLTLILVVISWLMITPKSERRFKDNWLTLFLVFSVPLLLSAWRYIDINGIIVANRPPLLWQVAIFLFGCAIVIAIIWRYIKTSATAAIAAIVAFILIFIILKTPFFAELLSVQVRQWVGQSPQLASSLDIRWIGFSYLAFRVIHTLFESKNGKLASMELNEFICYVLFPPSLTAGPIDRIERFLPDLHKQLRIFDNPDQYFDAFKRILFGLFKKFVIADTLGLIALSQQVAEQTTSTLWLWIIVYASALQIYFDFSGYTDLAIGLGKILGVDLPENFKKPYLKTNLALFWNSWHITLTQWFRTYYFNPITRKLRKSKIGKHQNSIMLVMQVTTMLLIGLWHGVSGHFIAWGLWHGLGMFIHNRFSPLMQKLQNKAQNDPILPKLWNGVSWVITFNFVALGWVWFLMPNVQSAISVFTILFGGK